jgi:hypothetical protein
MVVASIATVRSPRQNTPGVEGRPTQPATAVNSARNGFGPIRRRARTSADAVGAVSLSTRNPAVIFAHTRR